jgi:hypothetical protein
LGGFAFRSPTDLSHARIAFFLRTLFTRPDLRRHVKQLRLCFPQSGKPSDQRDEHEESNLTACPLNFFTQIVCPSRHLIDALDIPTKFKEMWRVALTLDHRYTLLSTLMALLPQLERLSFSENSSDTWLYSHDRVLNMIGIHPRNSSNTDLECIENLPIVQSLRFLKLSTLTPIRLDGFHIFPRLDTLDVSIKLAGLENHDIQHLSRLYCSPEAVANFRSIRHLRVDCQTKTVGIWDFSARSGMTHILQAFPELVSLDFYAEPSSEKNPFRSVRAFPHYQANIQAYPSAALSSDYDVSTGDTYWDERLYAARTEWTDYQYLVDSLFHIRPHMRSLRLPGGFWTLPGATRKPLPRFVLFSQLQNLAVPQAAILSIKLFNMRFPETVQGDFDLSPVDVLPTGLQHLEIFDADVDLLQSNWLQALFDEQAAGKRWPILQKVEILFGPAVTGTELKDLLTRQTGSKFWALADQADFQISVRRDDGVPMIDE